MKRVLFFIVFGISISNLFSQNGYWQQHVNYKMEIDFDAKKGRFSGTQNLIYTNNSPDTLKRVFYHLQYNAFQPGSQMDMRNQTIIDSDSRIGEKISNLDEETMGYHKVLKLTQDNISLEFEVVGTILEVKLNTPILPSDSTEFNMEFVSQIPPVIRRTGKNNSEGIEFSMSQWYPKMVEYDKDGWHANPYIAREFYGVWGNFDVKITIDSSYLLGATGYLQNAYEIGKGYSDVTKSQNKEKLTWHFYAPMVHDFVWAADKDYVHDKMQLENGPEVHFIYQPDTTRNNWEYLKENIQATFDLMNNTFGKYPYNQYSFIQAGDGGMEYPMATLVQAERKQSRFFGTCIHELIHSWYHGVLANNEAKHAWMDEGFTSYAEDFVLDSITPDTNRGPRIGKYYGYYYVVSKEQQEPLNTHSDCYHRNRTYYITAYQKGAFLLHQLRYIMGDEVFFEAMRTYFNVWKFKHPQPDDFIRIMEKEADMELDWFYHYWVETNYEIDYAITGVTPSSNRTKINVERFEEIPIPVEIEVILKNGEKHRYYFPLRIMRGEKHFSSEILPEINEDWPWTYPTNQLEVPFSIDNIRFIIIDPDRMTADINRRNNVYDTENPKKHKKKRKRKNK